MLKNIHYFKLIIIYSLSFLVMPIFAEQLLTNVKIKYIPEIEDKYNEGLSDYRAKRYQESAQIFEELTKFNPVHQRITLSHLMYGKSLLKQGKYTDAILVFRNFLATFPGSRYAENAHFGMGEAFYLMGNQLSSTREFLWIIDNGTVPQLIQKSKTLAEYMLEGVFTVNNIQNVIAELPGEKSLGLLVYHLTQKQVAQGNSDTAVNTIIDFLNEHPRNEYVKPLEAFLDKIRIKEKSDLKIGVILPLQAGYAADGKEILSGIEYALKEFKSANNLKIALDIRDSGSNVIKAIHAAEELAQDENVLCIIGELESNITAAIAALLKTRNIPVISPVASQNGIASIGENIFQANSDLFERGKQIALYAMKELNMKTFATLAPADNYGEEMTEGFVATVENLGGTIVSPPKWYFQGSKDLSRQLRSIRALGFKLMREDSAWMRGHAGLYTRAAYGDSFLVPVTSIHGLFCPVYSDDIDFLGPQCAALNLRAPLLGGDYWFTPDILRKNQSYVNGVVFVSDYFVDEFAGDYRRFRTNFRLKMSQDLGRMETYGYDLMKAILTLIQQNNISTRQKLRQHMETLDKFQGVKSLITWKGNNRVNSEVNILEFKNGVIKKLK